MAAVADRLMPGRHLVVLNEDKKAVGLITHADYLKDPKGKIADSNFNEPQVCPEFKIGEALKLMSDSGKDALPVFREDLFEGVLTNLDLNEFLISEFERYKLVFQKVAHDIRNPIANIIGQA